MATTSKEDSVDSNPYLDTTLIARIQSEYPRDHDNFDNEMAGLDENSISIPEYIPQINNNKGTMTCIISDYIDIDNSPITLDIGGSIFRTTLSTLKQYPQSLFSKMFSGKYSMKPNKNGSYFLDRDGTNFRYILNYLRTSKLIIPTNNKQLIAELLEECKFYHIPPLINILSIKQIDTVILNDKHISRLNDFIINNILPNNEDINNNDKTLAFCWKLLYRFESSNIQSNKHTKFSRNTLESSYVVLKDFVFLSKIAGFSPTLIVISADKYILGGFTTIKWPSHCSQWKKKTILSNDSTHSTWDFLEFWSPKYDECCDQLKYTFIYKFVDDDNQCKFQYKTTESKNNEFGHPELHGAIKTHREDWNQSPLPYFRTFRSATDCFDKSKPLINDKDHLYLYNVDGSIAINNPWTKQQSYVRSWECFQLKGYRY